MRLAPGPFIALLLVAACSEPGAPAADLIAVPTQTEGPLVQVGPQACPAALLEGELVPDEEFGFVVAHPDGLSSPVTWPYGYVARDAERRELLDETGRVVAREGDQVALGGGEGQQGPGFVVCGQLDVFPN